MDDPRCGLCGEAMETTDHLLLHCAIVRPILYICPLRIDLARSPGISIKYFVWSSLDNCPQEYGSMLAFLAWEIWTARNVNYIESLVFDFRKIMRTTLQNLIHGLK